MYDKVPVVGGQEVIEIVGGGVPLVSAALYSFIKSKMGRPDEN